MLGIRRKTTTRRDALTIARIVRVNHAGEYAAIRIYSVQIAVARRFFPDMVEPLEEMLDHERLHCAAFREAMPERNTKPCRIMQLWAWGGTGLGLLTAIMGRPAIWICTAAVETAVHRHLEDQLYFLDGRDDELHATISGIKEEELLHLAEAEARSGPTPVFRKILWPLITLATNTVIWLSTWGDSARMARDLDEAHARDIPAIR